MKTFNTKGEQITRNSLRAMNYLQNVLKESKDDTSTEAAYTVFRILQTFPDITIPSGEKVELVGVEKQTITLVISIAEGCKVHIQ